MTPASLTSRACLESASVDPAIRLEGVDQFYPVANDDQMCALSSISLEVDRREFVVILGPSGCGKTTLLRIIAGLTKPSAGRVEVKGDPLWTGDRRNDRVVRELAVVFQDANLFPWRNIETNVALPLKLRGVAKAERLTRARELCRLVGIGGFETRWPHELSGGMRQRAAIARALSYAPDILLMDEPFGALDALTRDQMTVELQRIGRANECTIVFVTHSINEAVFLADRVVLLTPRPGRVDMVMDVSFARPRDLYLQNTPAFQGLVSTLRKRLDLMNEKVVQSS